MRIVIAVAEGRGEEGEKNGEETIGKTRELLHVNMKAAGREIVARFG